MLEKRLLVRNVWLAHSRKISGHPNFLHRIWNSWVPIPTGVGLTLLCILQWRRLQKERRKNVVPETACDWELTCYKSLPLRAMSRMCGHLSSVSLPTALRHPVYGSFARVYSVNTSEMAQPIGDYRCFGDFFSRDLKEGVRPVDNRTLVSPADGTVLNVGKLESLQIEQVKGVTYSIKAFLGDLSWKNKIEKNDRDINFNKLTKPSTLREDLKTAENWNEYKKQLLHNENNELYQCIIYLAPGDYHRFHSPVDWKVDFRRHFSGELLSVTPSIARWVPNLFTINERVVYFGTWEHGFFSLAAVGATNVGSIRVYDDKELKTNNKLGWKKSHSCNYFPKEVNLDVYWKRGQQIGEFRLGSTIVLLLEAPKDVQFNIERKQQIKVGKGILTSMKHLGLDKEIPVNVNNAFGK